MKNEVKYKYIKLNLKYDRWNYGKIPRCGTSSAGRLESCWAFAQMTFTPVLFEQRVTLFPFHFLRSSRASWQSEYPVICADRKISVPKAADQERAGWGTMAGDGKPKGGAQSLSGFIFQIHPLRLLGERGNCGTSKGNRRNRVTIMEM